MGQVRIAAEDRFALLTPGLEGAALPSFGEARNLARAVGELARAYDDPGSRWEAMWDVRTLKGDGDRRYPAACRTLSALLTELHTSPRPQPILVRPGQADNLAFYMDVPTRSPIIEMQPKPLPKRALDLRVFEDEELDPYEVFDALPTSVQDYLDAAIGLGLTTAAEHNKADARAVAEETMPAATGLPDAPPIPVEIFEPLGDMWAEAIELRRVELISQVLDSVAVNSLLVQVAISSDESGQIHVVPYHSYSLHGVATSNDEVVLMRPGRRSGRYWSRFRSEILALEQLLNDPRVKERDIEQHLLANPLFLHGLNYGNVYSQVVLPRVGAPHLRPDLIAEPIGERWADIIDFKRPVEDILVGSQSRVRLAAGLNEAAAQLREYHAYFDDRTMARRVEEQLGISCYKPKMVVIVGRDPSRYTPDQQRRAMTAYPDLEVVTYDRLLRAARDRLLL